ncbi:crossover junction endonuclease MUS81 [Tirmania nivea]|nr:crossover junction endonuclease MUS81 [Tirmania nivea]
MCVDFNLIEPPVYLTRAGMPDQPTCANPILLQFIKEWMDVEERRACGKLYQSYKKAYESLKAHPDVLRHPCEAEKLLYIGSKISSRLTTDYQKYCQENNIPMPEIPRSRCRKRRANAAQGEARGDYDGGDVSPPPSKRPRKQTQKLYVPVYRSGPYALLLALYEEQLAQGGSSLGGMTRRQLTDVAQKYCDNSFTAPSDVRGYYTAWEGMKSLTGKHLVWEGGKPKKYSLSDAGEEVARGIMKVQRMREKEDGGGDEEEGPTTTVTPISGLSTIPEAIGSNTSFSTFSPFTPTPWPPGTFNIHLILDSREVRSKSDRTYLQTELSTRGVIPITRPLHLGDVLWIARHNTSGEELILDYIIERKRMDDLVGSIKDGRFHEQKWRLRRSGVKNIIYLIEDLGNWVPGGSNGGGADDGGYMREAVNTAISSTQVVNGFFLKRTSKVDDSIRYLARMHNFLTKLYAKQTLYPIPSHLLSSKTYTTGLQPHLTQMYPEKDFYPEYDAWNKLVDKSGQLTHRDVFLKMLMCIRGISAEKAIEIQRAWKTPGELLGAFEGCKTEEERWEMVMKGVGARGVGRRKIGKALSKKVCEVWWGKEE